MKNIMLAMMVAVSLISCSTVSKVTVTPSQLQVKSGDFISFEISSDIPRCVALSDNESTFDKVQVIGTVKAPVETNARYKIFPQTEKTLTVNFSDCNTRETLASVTLSYTD